MTVQEAAEKLRRSGFPPISRPAWLKEPVGDAERLRKIEAESEARKRKMREDADRQIEKQRKHKRELVAESLRHRELIREESIVRRQEADRVELVTRQDFRAFITAIGGHLSERDQQQWADELEEQDANPNDPIVVMYRGWLERVVKENGIDWRQCVDPRLRNGAAARTGGYIETPTVQSIIAGIIVAHELGHLLHAPIPDERLVPNDFGQKISPSSEIQAWQWVLDYTPYWDDVTHAFMVRCLNSYEPSANDAEKADMDAICSPLNVLRVRLRIASA